MKSNAMDEQLDLDDMKESLKAFQHILKDMLKSDPNYDQEAQPLILAIARLQKEITSAKTNETFYKSYYAKCLPDILFVFSYFQHVLSESEDDEDGIDDDEEGFDDMFFLDEDEEEEDDVIEVKKSAKKPVAAAKKKALPLKKKAPVKAKAPASKKPLPAKKKSTSKR